MSLSKYVLFAVLSVSLSGLAGCSKSGKGTADADKIEQAYKYYQEKSKENPGTAASAKYKLKLGIICLKTGDYNRAVSEFVSVIDIDPSIAEAHYNLGYAYQMLGNDDSAITEYKNAITIRPDYSDAYNNLGLLMVKKGYVKEGIYYLRKSQENDSDFSPAYYNLGAIYLAKMKDNDMALDYFARYLNINPSGEKSEDAIKYVELLKSKTGGRKVDTAELYYKRGLSALEVGDIKTAVSEFRKSIKDNPRYPYPYRELGLLYQDRVHDDDKALEYFEQYLEMNYKGDDAAEIMRRVKLLRKKGGEKESPPEKAVSAKADVPAKDERKIAEEREKSLSELKKKGAEYYSSGDYDKSVEAYKSALALEPGSVDIISSLGVVCLKAGNYAEAKEYFTRALELDPSDKNSIEGVIAAERNSGNREAAAALLVKAGRKNEAADIYRELGSGLVKEKKYREAINSFDKAGELNTGLDLKKEKNDAAYRSGKAGLASGDIKNAEQMLEYLKANGAGREDVCALNGEILLAEKDFAGAAAELEKAYSVSRSGELKKSIAGALISDCRQSISKGDLVQAEKTANKALVYDPSSSEIIYDLAKAYRAKGKDDESAYKYFKLYADKFPAAGHIREAKEFTAGYEKQMEEKDSYRKKMLVVDESATQHYNLAVTYTKQANYDRAIEEYKKAIQIDPTFTVAHYNLAILYRKKNNLPLAVDSYKNAIKSDPRFEKAYVNMGFILKETGDYDTAISYFKKALTLDQKNPVVHLGLAQIYDLKKYNNDLALYHYEKYLELEPNGKYSANVSARIKVLKTH
ncbi:MAG: tetratricopeptide repeat protein [Candidatus Aureabacteria bacterium]|nr:tetratricopeptide repeat protein [Candidatus Auribacterota bacterium]